MHALRRIFLLTGLIFGLAALGAPLAVADTVGPITFEPPTYTLGDINGQNGWTKTGPYDVAVASVSTFPAAAGYGFGAQSLRISNAVTSGSFGDQTFSPGLSQAAGESALRHFDSTFRVGTALSTLQSDLRMTVSPDDGNGGRMSFLRLEDQADGVHVFFSDVTNPGPFPTVSNFVTTDIATISRGAAHTIRVSIDFVAGPGNDVVKVYVDGVLETTGTTWENYYRYDPEQAGNGNVVPTTSKILIRESGVPAPLNLNNGFLVDGLSLASSTPVTTNCNFVFSGGQYMDLRNDCTTDGTILIPNGYELRGYQHTITAIDPPGAYFVGAVVKNAGASASVTRLKVTTSGLDDVCHAGDDRLRGIMLDGASGRISFNTVTNINQGQSGCQEGNAIEVRNAPFDGTHPGTKTILVNENTIRDYQKTGIVANGDINVNINHNRVGASSVANTLIAANSIQLAFGAIGQIRNNVIDGNQYCGTADDTFATAILLFAPSPGAQVVSNNIDGNSDVGIYTDGENGSIDHNSVTDDHDDPGLQPVRLRHRDLERRFERRRHQRRELQHGSRLRRCLPRQGRALQQPA